MAAKAPAMSPSDVPVQEVLDRVTGPRRADADRLLALHEEVSGDVPVVWANRIIGFGQYRYVYDSGHSGIAPLLGFASGQAKSTVYLAPDFTELWPDLMERLGKYKASKACLYITRLDDIDQSALKELLERTLEWSLAMDTPGA